MVTELHHVVGCLAGCLRHYHMPTCASALRVSAEIQPLVTWSAQTWSIKSLLQDDVYEVIQDSLDKSDLEARTRKRYSLLEIIADQRNGLIL